MPLTPAQNTALKNDIAANSNTIPAGRPFAGTAISALPNTADANEEIARWYNLTASPAWVVWRDLPMEVVLDTIAFASMTPADAVPTTPALTVDVYRARSLACQGKQFNLQNLTLGRTTAPMKRATYRAGLQDCLTNIPAGAGGSLISANWVGVRDAAKFNATNAEKLFSTGTGTTAAPADLGREGPISKDDVEAARNS